jgi:hypothetical protein
MLVLDTTTALVRLVTSAVCDVQVCASYADYTTPTTFGIDGQNTLITTAATTTVVASPTGSIKRNVKSLCIRNAHATTAVTIGVEMTDGTTAVKLIAFTLAAGEFALMNGEAVWFLYDTNGAVKAGTGTGRWLKSTVLTSGTTFTTQPATTSIFVRVQGPGGGGGGVALNAAGSGTCAGGGAAGSYAEKTFTVTGNTAYTYAIGAAGAAGASGGGTGGNAGGATTFAVGGVTVTAPSGLGGTFIGTGAVHNYALGGASGAVATNGDLNTGGEAGRIGVIIVAGVVGVGGGGGCSDFGSGGPERKTTGAGTAGLGFGSGGSGGLSLTAGAAAAGGAGTAGVIVVDEYS